MLRSMATYWWGRLLAGDLDTACWRRYQLEWQANTVACPTYHCITLSSNITSRDFIIRSIYKDSY